MCTFSANRLSYCIGDLPVPMDDVACIQLEYKDLLDGEPKYSVTKLLAPFAVWIFELFFEIFPKIIHDVTLNQPTVASSCLTNCTTLTAGHIARFALLSNVPKPVADGLRQEFPLAGVFDEENVTVHISCCEPLCMEFEGT